MSRTMFVILFFVVGFSVIIMFSEKGIGSILLSHELSKSFSISSFGFILAKVVSGNSRRTWIELAWFQLLNFGCVFTFIILRVLGVDNAYRSLVAFLIMFLVSWFIFLRVGKAKKTKVESTASKAGFDGQSS